MSTKAELQAENEILRELVDGGTTIRDCTFTGSPSSDACEAVKEIALALQHAAKALAPAPMLTINAPAIKVNEASP